jgi:hypothetical protein
MVGVSIAVAASDAVSASTCSVTGVTSSQSANGKGDGNRPVDWSITGPLAVQLRAERAGNDAAGRIYTVAVTCSDASGNSSSATTTVAVSHDKGRK